MSIVVGAVFTLWIFLFARVERSTLAERSISTTTRRTRPPSGQEGSSSPPPIPSVDARVVGALLPSSTRSRRRHFRARGEPESGQRPRAVALLASMRTFLRGDGAVRALLVVVPDRELDWWRLAARAVDASDFDLDVVGESRALATPSPTLRAAAPETRRGVPRRRLFIQMFENPASPALVRDGVLRHLRLRRGPRQTAHPRNLGA